MDRLDDLTDLVLHEPDDPGPRDLRVGHLWLRDLTDEHLNDGTMTALSTEERFQATRFRRAMDRRRFVARHVFVRRILGEIVGRPPEALEFRIGRCGKPQLISQGGPGANASSTLDFSVSYSGDVLGLAVAWGRAVGLDLEIVRPVADPVGIAAMKFPYAPLGGLATVPPPDRDLAFYRLWTEIEACAKMQGRGLDCRHAREPPDVVRWTTQSFTFEWDRDRIVGAVALENPTTLSTRRAAGAPTPSALPWPWAGARYSRTSGSAWPAARSSRSTACRSS